MGRIRKISEQTIWQLLGRAVSTSVSVVTLGFISRSLGTTGTGIYTLAITYLAFFNLLADLGINAHVLPRLLGKEFSLEWNKFFGLRLTLSLFLMAIASLIVIFWPGLDSLFRVVVLIGNLAIINGAVYVTCVAYFQSKLRYDLSSISFILSPLATIMAIILVLKLNLGVPGVMGAQVFGSIVLASTALFLVNKFIKPRPVFDFGYMKNTLLASWALASTMVVNMIYFRLDAFILKFYRSFSEVGIYNLAYQIFQAGLFVPAYIMNSSYPLLIDDFRSDKPKFLANLKKALFIMLGLSTLATLFILLFSPLIINIISGNNNFAGSIRALRVLSLSFPAFFLTSVLMTVQMVLKKYKSMLGIYCIGFLFNGVANLFFIPQYSYLAAAWITVFSEYLILILQAFILIFALKKQ